MPETIPQFYKRIHSYDSQPDTTYSKEKTYFNVFSRQCNFGTVQFSYREFFELEKSRIHYVVIAGRRSDYKEKTYELRRRLLKSNNILLLHYDNLFKVEALLESTLGEY